MTIARRFAAAGTLFIAGTALTACGASGDTPAAVTQSPAPTAAETILDGMPDASTPAFHYSVKGGTQPLAGVIDPAGKALTTGVSQKVPDTPITLTMNFLVVEDQVWAKIAFEGPTAGLGLPKLPKKWMSLDPAKAGGSDVADLEYSDAELDPGYVTALVESADGLTESVPGRFTGTTDLTKSAEAEIVTEETLTALGEKAKAVPLEVAVDGDGRVTGATVKIPAAGKAKASTYAVTYGKYGTAESLGKPAAAVKAPAVVYEMLNG